MTLFACSLASGVGAQEIQTHDAENGAQLYRHFCASCHGLEGRGSGPMAPVLLVQPADLTTLKERNGGSFPYERVAARIDGRDPLVSHGSDMPVFGWLLTGDPVPFKLPSGQPMLVDRTVADLIAWLERLQE
ncbi:c-type cytochrome [Roseobacteraceae bacterium NS-SX3]